MKCPSYSGTTFYTYLTFNLISKVQEKKAGRKVSPTQGISDIFFTLPSVFLLSLFAILNKFCRFTSC